MAEPGPAVQQQYVPLTLVEAVEGVCQPRALAPVDDAVGLDVRGGTGFCGEPAQGGELPPFGAPLAPYEVRGDPVQPWPRVLDGQVEPPPLLERDREHTGCDVIG